MPGALGANLVLDKYYFDLPVDDCFWYNVVGFMEDHMDERIVVAPPSPKKNYRRPELVEYGDLVQVTQSGLNGTDDVFPSVGFKN